MSFLYALSNIRFPLLDQFMLLITHLGEETAFLVIALAIFWCVDKLQGYYILGVGFCGTILNQFLKLACRVPRPWVQDVNFKPVAQAIPEATGYSFPSGHSQSAVGVFGCLAVNTKNKIFRYVCIAIAVLVPFSRMYLGVHFPSDVLVGAGSALVLVGAMRYMNEGKYLKQSLFVMCGLAVAYLVYVSLIDPATMDELNYSHGVENAYTLLGATIGMLAGYFIDNKWIHFDVKAIWWAQILKVVGGLIVVLAVKEGTKPVLNLILGDSIGRAVRYALVVLVAGCVWPLSFRWFAKLGKKA